MLHSLLNAGLFDHAKKGVEEGWLDVHELTAHGENALCTQLLAYSRGEEIADYLISKGVSLEGDNRYINAMPLFRAIRHSNLVLAKKLLRAGAKIDAKTSIGNNIWHTSASGSGDCTEWLKEINAPGINEKNDHGFTPLALAISGGRCIADIKLLLNAGAKIGKLSDPLSPLALSMNARHANHVIYAHYLKERAQEKAKAREEAQGVGEFSRYYWYCRKHPNSLNTFVCRCTESGCHPTTLLNPYFKEEPAPVKEEVVTPTPGKTQTIEKMLKDYPEYEKFVVRCPDYTKCPDKGCDVFHQHHFRCNEARCPLFRFEQGEYICVHSPFYVKPKEEPARIVVDVSSLKPVEPVMCKNVCCSKFFMLQYPCIPLCDHSKSSVKEGDPYKTKEGKREIYKTTTRVMDEMPQSIQKPEPHPAKEEPPCPRSTSVLVPFASTMPVTCRTSSCPFLHQLQYQHDLRCDHPKHSVEEGDYYHNLATNRREKYTRITSVPVKPGTR